MRVKSSTPVKCTTICRINKSSADKIVSKRYYYYIHKEKDKPDEIVFIDNTKGKATKTEFATIEELEKHAKEVIKKANK